MPALSLLPNRDKEEALSPDAWLASPTKWHFPRGRPVAFSVSTAPSVSVFLQESADTLAQHFRDPSAGTVAAVVDRLLKLAKIDENRAPFLDTLRQEAKNEAIDRRAGVALSCGILLQGKEWSRGQKRALKQTIEQLAGDANSTVREAGQLASKFIPLSTLWEDPSLSSRSLLELDTRLGAYLSGDARFLLQGQLSAQVTDDAQELSLRTRALNQLFAMGLEGESASYAMSLVLRSDKTPLPLRISVAKLLPRSAPTQAAWEALVAVLENRRADSELQAAALEALAAYPQMPNFSTQREVALARCVKTAVDSSLHYEDSVRLKALALVQTASTGKNPALLSPSDLVQLAALSRRDDEKEVREKARQVLDAVKMGPYQWLGDLSKKPHVEKTDLPSLRRLATLLQDPKVRFAVLFFYPALPGFLLSQLRAIATSRDSTLPPLFSPLLLANVLFSELPQSEAQMLSLADRALKAWGDESVSILLGRVASPAPQKKVRKKESAPVKSPDPDLRSPLLRASEETAKALAALGSARVNTRYLTAIPALTRALQYYLEHKADNRSPEELAFSTRKLTAVPALAKAIALLVNEQTDLAALPEAYTWWRMATNERSSLLPITQSDYLARMKAGLE